MCWGVRTRGRLKGIARLRLGLRSENMFLLYFLASGFIAASFRVEWRTGSFKVVRGCGVFQRVGMLRRTVGGGVRAFRGRTGILDFEFVLFW